MSETTLLVLLDSFRYDYLDPSDTPYLWELHQKNTYVEKIFNPGGYCERSVFMTGADPEVTDNYFAMALMPMGYQRPYWEPRFNVPPIVRNRLAMTEDNKLDFEPGSFKNYTTGQTIESFWDVMRKKGKTFAVEACVALGVRSYKGKTTHGTRPIQLADQFKEGHNLYYIQYSEIDQKLHYRGTTKEARRSVLKQADGSVKWLVDEANKHFDKVNLVIFGDHGMSDVTEKVDIPLEYPPYVLGWDYLYLKSSAAIQFWVFNPNVYNLIYNDPRLKEHGKFIEAPTPRQGDVVWRSNFRTLVSPCHFHPKNDPIKAMHGFDPAEDEQKGMAIISGDKKTIEEARLNDLCPTICDLVGVPHPKYNQGRSLL